MRKLSWATLAVTTCAILLTAVDGGILPAVLPAVLAAICLLGIVPLARMTETVEVR